MHYHALTFKDQFDRVTIEEKTVVDEDKWEVINCFLTKLHSIKNE